MQYDLIIVGGGVVGAGFAAGLKHTGLKVALVDARLPSNEDPRLFAMNVSGCQFLTNLGVWPELAPHASPIKQVHVSHRGHFGAVRLHHEDADLPSLGHVIPACQIEKALNQCLDELPNADMYRPARLVNLTQTDGIAELTLDTDDGEKKITSSIVIGADGTGSTVRKLINIDTNVVNYEQCAIVTRVQLKRSHQGIAYERFVQHGAVAMLPLPDNQCASIWSADKDEAERLMNLSDAEYLSELQTAFGYRVGKLQAIMQRYKFPLNMVRAQKTYDGCVLLLGNSAHTLHPIAAQGFNLALFEAATLIDGITARLDNCQTVTCSDLYAMLQQARQQQNVSMNVSHWLTQLFSRDTLPVNCLLSLGMTGFDLLPPLKRKFIGLMTGRAGRVPSLLMKQLDNEKHDASRSH